MSDRADCEAFVRRSNESFVGTMTKVGAGLGAAAGLYASVKLAVPVTIGTLVASGVSGAALGAGAGYSASAEHPDPRTQVGAPLTGLALGGMAGMATGNVPWLRGVALGAAGGAGLGNAVAELLVREEVIAKCSGEKVSHADASEVLPPLATPVAAAPAKGPVRS